MEPFKNIYNKKSITELAKQISLYHSNFDQKLFLQIALKKINTLEMKERVIQLSEALSTCLTSSYSNNIKILLKTIYSEKNKNGIKGFMLWPYTYYIETHGINNFKISMNALYEITKAFTSEFGIRRFIETSPVDTYKILDKWAQDPNEHIRRLVSEGTRPNLPWGIKVNYINNNLDKNIKLLEYLKQDSSLYVRKSVANHMNDISRINPELAIKTLKKWTKIKDKNMDWVVKHALRSLIKQGLPEALNILGYNSKANISVKNFKLSPKKINEGEKINLSFKIKNDSAKAENIVVDYNIHYLKSNGTHSIKVFKLKNLKINKNETISISKNITIKKVTTRKHYSGEHKLSIQINGKPHLEKRFSLIC